jgi:hypothetical protein
MHKFVHVIKSERRLYSIGIILILVLMSFVPQWGWLRDIEAQNKTNESSMVQNTTKVDEILSGICASSNNTSNNTSNVNDSQNRDIVEIRCILRDARNAISADAANTAIQLIDQADNKLVSVLGVDNNESTTNITNSTAIN